MEGEYTFVENLTRTRLPGILNRKAVLCNLWMTLQRGGSEMSLIGKGKKMAKSNKSTALGRIQVTLMTFSSLTKDFLVVYHHHRQQQ